MASEPTAAPAAVWSLIAVGTVCVVAGGLVSAVSASGPSEHSAWAVAYLVLVAGAAQVGLGLGQMLLASRGPWTVGLALELGCWNLGNAAVVAGVLLGVTALVDIGGVLLVVALGLAVHEVRGAGSDGHPGGQYRLLLHGFRALVMILLVSIPVGLVLAR